MERLPQDVWLDRCTRRIVEIERDVSADEARRLARALKSFERTGVMPPEAAVDFVSQQMARADRGRFERRRSPRA
ncbi:MAG TPA: hypothetical protein VJ743_20450 [Albitalea sp.]|nr:hypothetical protein [Albitalea sp.]